MTGVFLDISKAFDKVWHSGLLFKLQAYRVEDQLLALLKDYLHDRQQRVVLNGQTSDWRKINSGVPQGSVLGPLLFLIFINDLPDGITSLCKIFADDTSLFSKVYDIDISPKELNSDLEKVGKSAFQWKMQFNPDPNRQANEVILSRKTKNSSHPPVAFNNNVVTKYSNHKHLGLVLHSKLDFKFHVDQKIKKEDSQSVSQGIPYSLCTNRLLGLILTMVIFCLINQKMKIFKITLKKFNIEHAFLELVQYKEHQGKNVDELGLHSLSKRRWCNKLIFIKY